MSDSSPYSQRAVGPCQHGGNRPKKGASREVALLIDDLAKTPRWAIVIIEAYLDEQLSDVHGTAGIDERNKLAAARAMLKAVDVDAQRKGDRHADDYRVARKRVRLGATSRVRSAERDSAGTAADIDEDGARA